MYQSDFWQGWLVKKLGQCKVSTQGNMPPSKIPDRNLLSMWVNIAYPLDSVDHYNFIKYVLSINIQTEIIMLTRFPVNVFVTQYTDFTMTRLTFTLLHDFMVHVYM